MTSLYHIHRQGPPELGQGLGLDQGGREPSSLDRGRGTTWFLVGPVLGGSGVGSALLGPGTVLGWFWDLQGGALADGWFLHEICVTRRGPGKLWAVSMLAHCDPGTPRVSRIS